MRKNLYNLWLITTCLCLLLSTYFLWSIAARLGTLDNFVYVNVEKILNDVDTKIEQDIAMGNGSVMNRTINHYQGI